ncbi:MAG: YjgP/YjgQ family permease [Prevotellaceae bacterium]|nr:YjgP/YjgQ family permease [Prevotellaceae bacterium]
MTLRIKKLDIFIARQFGLLFVGTFFICQFVLMMQFLWKYIDDLIGKGLTLDVLAQFFWYMSIMLVPQALPLAILLSSLITFGNLGESSELTAIKAAGISLMQTFRSLIVIVSLITITSFVFQNNIGPRANMKLAQLVISMKQKSPELEIPEGIFYDGIPDCNIYVQKKNIETGRLYGIMIYRMTNSYEDAAIILADSGMIQSTAEKKHLILSLWSGEWFENMQEQQFGGSAAVPYRRETFTDKKIILDFNGDFSLTDAASLSNNAAGKSLAQITYAIDSLNHSYDSIGRAFYNEAQRMYYVTPAISRHDSLKAVNSARKQGLSIDDIFKKLKPEDKQMVLSTALGRVQQEKSDLEFKALMTTDAEKILRLHQMEAINKFTLALQCMLFFFIGAPLGTIIRKGGLGLPVIISVLVFILYLIADTSGFRMARQGSWSVWFGKLIAMGMMTPVAVFITYKALNDSVVFNADGWKNFMMRALGLRDKRNISSKEVIIEEPHYKDDADALTRITEDITRYSKQHNLVSPPNIIKVFFKYQRDNEIEEINTRLEVIIKDLSNTRDRQILSLINQYPILILKAHTRPFDKKWENILAAIILPAGIFFYLRMWRFRWRLLRDLRVIKTTNTSIINYTQKHLVN